VCSSDLQTKTEQCFHGRPVLMSPDWRLRGCLKLYFTVPPVEAPEGFHNPRPFAGAYGEPGNPLLTLETDTDIQATS
jgi:hypothetical protein